MNIRSIIEQILRENTTDTAFRGDKQGAGLVSGIIVDTGKFYSASTTEQAGNIESNLSLDQPDITTPKPVNNKLEKGAKGNLARTRKITKSSKLNTKKRGKAWK